MRILGRTIPASAHRLPPLPPPSEAYYDDDGDGDNEGSGAFRNVAAAAQRFISRTVRRSRNHQAAKNGAWQTEAWERYLDTPEVRFAATWIANAMSRAKLGVGIINDNGDVEDLPDGHPAIDLIAQIAGGPDGQSQMLKQFGIHLVVAGEGWLVVEPVNDENAAETDEEDTDLLWHVLSVDEVKREQRGELTAIIEDREVTVPSADDANEDDPIAIRIWDPSPRRRVEADSPVRSSLGLLDELRLLNASVKAIARSRLVGRGILAVPQGSRFPAAPGTSDAEDDLLETIMAVAETAYKDPESAAATVPILLEVPREVMQEIKLIKFDSEFDEIAIKLREEAIRRFATGLDTPAEVLLGMGSINHWGQWALTEEAIRVAIEPRLSILADALTRQWIRPILRENENVENVGRIVVLADSAPLRVRSNRSQTALEVFKEGGIGLEALRRETGFDEDDAPTDEDSARSLLVQLLLAQPQYAPSILPVLGIDVPGLDAGTDGGDGSPTDPDAGGDPDDLPADETTSEPDDAGTEREAIAA